MEKLQGITHEALFSYDTAGRLKTVTRDGVLSATYAFDPNGNRLSKVGPGGSAAGTYDDQDRMLTYGTASYSYGANGELRTKVVGSDTTRYTYDAMGNLVQVLLPDGTDIEYVIDAQNRRVGKKVNGTLVKGWLYQGQLSPLAELDGTGNVTARFIYGTRTNVPDLMIRGDTTYRLISDAMGSVRLILNLGTLQVVESVDYDENGVPVSGGVTLAPFGFAGGLADAQTGLVRFGARDYDPASGRWTAKEPLRFKGTLESQYVYCFADPVNLIDITGLVPRPVRSITRAEGIAIVNAAALSGEWTYSWNRTAWGEEAVDYAARIGDCTDYVKSAVETALGNEWVGAGAEKPNTKAFRAGRAAGYSQIARDCLQPGDIVVQGNHAGVVVGWDKNGVVVAYQNPGTPAEGPDLLNHTNGDTRMEKFYPGGLYGPRTPQYFRPLVYAN